MKHYLIKSSGEVNDKFSVGENSLESLQKAVGGYIEYAPYNMPNTKVIVNEEGLLSNLPINLIATGIAGRLIVGDVVVETTNPQVQKYIKEGGKVVSDIKLKE